MSEEDDLKWKAKHIKGDHERIEIRKLMGGTNLCIIVYKKAFNPRKPVFPEYDGGGRDWYWKQANVFFNADCAAYNKRHLDIRMSTNGKLNMTWVDWCNLNTAVTQAITILT